MRLLIGFCWKALKALYFTLETFDFPGEISSTLSISNVAQSQLHVHVLLLQMTKLYRISILPSHATKYGAGWIWTVTICGTLSAEWSLYGYGYGLISVGLGLRIVVYTLLEEVTKCGSITWLKLTNGEPPRRSAPLRILSCPVTVHNILMSWSWNVTKKSWNLLMTF